MANKKHKKKKKNPTANATKKVPKKKGSAFKNFTRVGAIVLVIALAASMIAMYAGI